MILVPVLPPGDEPAVRAVAADESRASGAAGHGVTQAVFNASYAELAERVGTDDPRAVRELADGARAIAAGAGEPCWESAVLLLVGANALQRGEHAEAMASYRTAETVALGPTGSGGGDAAVQQRVARMGVANVQQQSGAYEDAARTYRGLAESPSTGEHLDMRVECWWLAAHCLAQAERYGQAWELGEKALQLASLEPPSPRRAKSMASAGKVLLAIAEKSRDHSAQGRAIDSQLEDALGKEWRTRA
jgi:tetratricopeptide (TPR) repeat protein